MQNGEKITQACNFLVKVHNEIKRMHNDLEILLAETIVPMHQVDEYSYSPNSLWVKDDYIRLWIPSDLDKFEENGECLYFIEQILFYEGNLARQIGKSILEPEIWFWLVKTENAPICKRAKPLQYDLFTDTESFVEDDVTADDKIYTYSYSSKDDKEKWYGWFLHKKLVEISTPADLKTSIVEPLFKKYKGHFGV